MKKTKIDKIVVIVILIALAFVLFITPWENQIGNSSIIGATISSVRVTGQSFNQTCVVDMYEGWNLVALACDPPNRSIQNVLLNLTGNYTSIHAYYPGTGTDIWRSYNPNLPSWVVQDLTQVSQEKGYWIKILTNSSLYIFGTITEPTEFIVLRGWNLIGYPLRNISLPSDAFSSINGAYTIVWSYNTTQDAYLYYSPILSSGTLTNISPNRGYWLNMTGDTLLWLT